MIAQLFLPFLFFKVLVFNFLTLEHDSASHNIVSIIHGIFLLHFSFEVWNFLVQPFQLVGENAVFGSVLIWSSIEEGWGSGWLICCGWESGCRWRNGCSIWWIWRSWYMIWSLEGFGVGDSQPGANSWGLAITGKQTGSSFRRLNKCRAVLPLSSRCFVDDEGGGGREACWMDVDPDMGSDMGSG